MPRASKSSAAAAQLPGAAPRKSKGRPARALHWIPEGYDDKIAYDADLDQEIADMVETPHKYEGDDPKFNYECIFCHKGFPSKGEFFAYHLRVCKERPDGPIHPFSSVESGRTFGSVHLAQRHVDLGCPVREAGKGKKRARKSSKSGGDEAGTAVAAAGAGAVSGDEPPKKRRKKSKKEKKEKKEKREKKDKSSRKKHKKDKESASASGSAGAAAAAAAAAATGADGTSGDHDQGVGKLEELILDVALEMNQTDKISAPEQSSVMSMVMDRNGLLFGAARQALKEGGQRDFVVSAIETALKRKPMGAH